MRFLETLFRHRLLAIVLVVLGVIVAAGYEAAQPRAYTSTADLWVDASTPGPSSTSNQYVDPSTTEQAVIQELIDTRSFELAVGHAGGLGSFLASHPGSQDTGVAALPGLGIFFKSSGQSIDSLIATLVSTDVTVTATGPQVVTLTDTLPDPAAAAGTLTAIINEFQGEIVQTQTASDQLAVSYYTQQLAQTESSLQLAEKSEAAYMLAHPNLPSNGGGDATAVELIQNVSDAESNRQSVYAQLQQAQLNLTNVANQTGIRVMDQPQPGSLVSIKKKIVELGIAGLVVGLIISLLIIAGITASDRTARRAEDVRRALGLEVAASIGQVSQGTATARRGEA